MNPLTLIKTARCKLFYELIRLSRGGAAGARYLGVKVGRNCRIITRSFGTEPWLVTIGEGVTIANNVALLTHDGSTWLIRDNKGRRFRYAHIEIGNDVFIGVNSIILPGVKIGDRVIIGAGSVVTRSVPNGVIVAGNPARIIGQFADYERRALTQLPSKDDMFGESWQEWINSVTEKGFRPKMRNDL